MNKNHVGGAPAASAAIPIANCPVTMPAAKTSMLSDDNTAMASRQPPCRAAARNGAGRTSQNCPTIITATATNM